ncbi:alpha-L-rhamnosidase [Cohnella sp. JJ-181]|uniref:alpha-L-rhamnosidase n=1 Tax=Cohnella rhizoplanae TaxID=2974897 RepID=UPI0022FFA1FA|nr:alpha-L-rhamnosidase [Cohnella sp. JJ-181]CAI6014648.1 Alpha-L-rhamnosidase [Cohnella sp. JJ-181]
MTLTIKELTCEYRSRPLGIDAQRPRLSWKLGSERRGAAQTGYRIQVAAGEADFSDPLWDTGRVESDASLLIPYDGPSLRSRTRYHYRIKVWDREGAESDWSETAWWETAVLSPDEWIASWIGADPAACDPDDAPSPLLRKTFELTGGIVSARLYATAAGLYELYLNGERVGEDLMTPGWTSYDKRLQYQTYDVTDALVQGTNAIGIALGNGWYKGLLVKKNNRYGNRRAALMQLHVVLADGSERVVATDPSWRASTGGVRFSEIYHGETFDARLEPAGWHTAEFDDSKWHDATAADPGTGRLVAQENCPVRVTERVLPVAHLRTPSGAAVLDYGQNLVGRVRLRLNVPAGTTLRLRHAEILDRDGNVYFGNLRGARQELIYTASGEADESYAAAFSFFGFRYVQVEGYPGQEEDGLPLEAFEAEVVHTDMPETGSFECSSELINQLNLNIRWGQRGNFLDVPTDCPQRDERLGWTGDAQVFVRTAAFHYQVGPFFAKWLHDLAADQLPDGGVPFVVPNVLQGHSSAAWGDAAVICPWTIYQCYGDVRLLEEQFDSMKAWVEFIRAQGDDEYLWNTGFHFGDWLGLDAKENSYIGATPKDFVATAYYAYSARLVRDAAVVLGKAEEVRRYGELHYRIVAAFRREFVTPGGRLAAPTQTAHALALVFDLVEGEVKTRVARELNELVAQNDYHLTTGFVGTPYLCFALSDNGYHETALKLLMQESYPSWLYPVKQGATTIWEHWDGVKPDGSFWSDDMNSFNHYAYGAIGDWLYRRVAGLDMGDAQTAYRDIRIAPLFGGSELSHASASLDSPYGRIHAGWRREADAIRLDVEVPAGTTATVRLPASSVEEIMTDGAPAASSGDVKVLSAVGGFIELRVGSGRYAFTCPAS